VSESQLIVAYEDVVIQVEDFQEPKRHFINTKYQYDLNPFVRKNMDMYIGHFILQQEEAWINFGINEKSTQYHSVNTVRETTSVNYDQNGGAQKVESMARI
jgi:hypothetical protein